MDDELELSSARAVLCAKHRTDVHRQEPRISSLADLPREIIRHDLVAGGENNHALDEIAQLTHVAGPWILHELLQRVAREAVKFPVVLLREFLDEAAHE